MINRCIKYILIPLFATIFSSGSFTSYAAMSSRGIQDKTSSEYSGPLDNMRGGIVYNVSLASYDVFAFYEYDFFPYLGVRVAIGYSKDTILVLPKDMKKNKSLQNTPELSEIKKKLEDNPSMSLSGLDESDRKLASQYLDGASGIYSVQAISIPLVMRLYPFAGGFCIYLGLQTDILLSAKTMIVNSQSEKSSRDFAKKLKLDEKFNIFDFIANAKKAIDESGIDTKVEEQNLNGEHLLNRFRFGVVGGLDYTMPIGLILGLNLREGLRSFVNCDANKSNVYDFNIQGTLGMDIIKCIQFVNSF